MTGVLTLCSAHPDGPHPGNACHTGLLGHRWRVSAFPGCGGPGVPRLARNHPEESRCPP